MRIILASLFISISLSIFAQTASFDRRNTVQTNNLTTILNQLSKRENILLAYDSELLENKYCLTDISKYPLRLALDIALKDIGLEYKIIDDNQVLIRRKVQIESKTLNLFGQVKDKSTHEALSYSLVYLKDANLGCYADSVGRFHIFIPTDYKTHNDTIVVSRIGYKDKLIALNDFVKNMDIELQIEARVFPTITILAPIKIFSINSDGLSTTINNKKYNNTSLGNNDILRKLQFLPSIAANKDNSAKIRIRGSETYETLVLLDGLRIYNPTHFYNVFSAVNDSYVSQTELYKNRIPPNIRSMTGGVVKLSSDETKLSNLDADLNINLMDISGKISLPISNSLSLIMAGRKSVFEHTKQSFLGDIITANQYQPTNDKIRNLNDRKKNQSFDYFDTNAKLSYQINTNHKINLVLYKSNDSYYNTFNQQIKRSNGKLFLDFDFYESSIWGNRGIGLNYKYNRNKLQSTISISNSNYIESNVLKIKILRKKDQIKTTKYISNTQSSSIADRVLKCDNIYSLSSNSQLKFGLDITKYMVKTDIKIGNNQILDHSKHANSYTLYLGHKLNHNKWITEYSLQSSYYNLKNRFYFDPSLSIQYNTTHSLQFFTSINRQHQYLRTLNYETKQGKNTSIWILSGNKMPILTSLNFAIGSKYKYNHTSITIEAYYKKKRGINTLLLKKPGSENEKAEYKLFFGKGDTRGIEFLWSQDVNKYNSQLAYSLSYNDYQFIGLFNSLSFPSPDDSRHQVKWIQTYRLNKFEFGVNTIYSSGLPYFDFSSLTRETPRESIDHMKYIRYLPDYFRLDFSSIYHFKIRNNNAQISLSIFNITNRINVTNRQIINPINDQQSTAENQTISSQTNLLSRTLNLGFKIRIGG